MRISHRNQGFPHLIFSAPYLFRTLFLLQTTLQSRRGRKTTGGIFALTVKSCISLDFRTLFISAPYLFPHLILILSHPRIPRRLASAGFPYPILFRTLFFSVPHFRERPVGSRRTYWAPGNLQNRQEKRPIPFVYEIMYIIWDPTQPMLTVLRGAHLITCG